MGPLFYAYERIEMSKSETYVKRTEEFLEKLSGELEFEVVDVEFVKEAGEYYLRAYCDMEGGIGIEDCAEISRRLSDWLDENDFIDEGYILEVSSPGLGRALKKDKDFLRELGKEVELKLYKPMEGVKDFEGVLKSFDGENITIETEDKDEVFTKKEIANIRLKIDF
ncbi:MAG: ribosome maturation factor RimP [Lachnospiraceae bacterium]|nr:ribosome maturation factor RimP [Lachnospiraceae bacterium]